MDVITSRAAVRTTDPARHAGRLVAQLERWVPFSRTRTADGPGHRAAFGTGWATVVVGDGELVLLAQAQDPGGLERVQHVLDAHLSHVAGGAAQRPGHRVAWS